MNTFGVITLIILATALTYSLGYGHGYKTERKNRKKQIDENEKVLL